MSTRLPKTTVCPSGPGQLSAGMKRAFDLLAAGTGLVVLSPLLVVLGMAVKFTSPGPIFFRQTRLGRGKQPFMIFKFRSMVVHHSGQHAQVTSSGDARITPIGRLLRWTKLDELPQLLNVLRGEMSLVGPRPEVPKYVAKFPAEFDELLCVRPGITGLASVVYRDEEQVLAQSPEPETAYLEKVLPAKIRLEQTYLRQRSFWFDLGLILRTFGKLVRS